MTASHEHRTGEMRRDTEATMSLSEAIRLGTMMTARAFRTLGGHCLAQNGREGSARNYPVLNKSRRRGVSVKGQRYRVSREQSAGVALIWPGRSV